MTGGTAQYAQSTFSTGASRPFPGNPVRPRVCPDAAVRTRYGPAVGLFGRDHLVSPHFGRVSLSCPTIRRKASMLDVMSSIGYGLSEYALSVIGVAMSTIKVAQTNVSNARAEVATARNEMAAAAGDAAKATANKKLTEKQDDLRSKKTVLNREWSRKAFYWSTGIISVAGIAAVVVGVVGALKHVRTCTKTTSALTGCPRW